MDAKISGWKFDEKQNSCRVSKSLPHQFQSLQYLYRYFLVSKGNTITSQQRNAADTTFTKNQGEYHQKEDIFSRTHWCDAPRRKVTPLCNIRARNVLVWSNHEKMLGKPKLKYWTVTFKSIKVMNDKEKFRNCHGLKTKKKWKPRAAWDADLDSGPEKGY